MKNICAPIRERFSLYLDGDVNGTEMRQVAAHLDSCAACRDEFEEWKAVQQVLQSARLEKVPTDLAVRLRVALSHERSDAERGLAGRLHDRWELFLDNRVRPFAVSGTVAAAVLLMLVLGWGFTGAAVAPSFVEANDEPLAGFSTPHYLYSAQGDADATPLVLDSPVTVEAQITSAGRVYNYRVLSGSPGVATSAALRERMLNAVFRPARALGMPVRGHVVMSYDGISVRP